MAISKKTATFIFVLIAVVILILIIYYFFFKQVACDPYNNGYDINGKVSERCKVGKPTGAVPTGSPSSNWNEETFPLNVGMYGSKIKALQSALSITSDGKFGNQTKAAIIAKGYSVPLSEADYNKIVIPASTGATSSGNINAALVGKRVYTNAPNVPIYNTPNDIFPFRFAEDDEYVGTYLGVQKSFFGRSFVKLQYTTSTIKYMYESDALYQ